MQISEDPGQRIELAIGVLGQTRSEMVPAMRQRGVSIIVDRVGLRDFKGASSQVTFELDRWVSIQAGFVNSEWEEMKSCCDSWLQIEGITLVSPYIKWLDYHAETPMAKERWRLPDYKVGVKLQRIHSHHVMFLFHRLELEKWPDDIPLDVLTYHY